MEAQRFDQNGLFYLWIYIKASHFSSCKTKIFLMSPLNLRGCYLKVSNQMWWGAIKTNPTHHVKLRLTDSQCEKLARNAAGSLCFSWWMCENGECGGGLLCSFLTRLFLVWPQLRRPTVSCSVTSSCWTTSAQTDHMLKGWFRSFEVLWGTWPM